MNKKHLLIGFCFAMVLFEYKLYLNACPDPYSLASGTIWQKFQTYNPVWGDYLMKYGITIQRQEVASPFNPSGKLPNFTTQYPCQMWGVDGFSMQMFYVLLSRWSLWNQSILNTTLHVMWFLATFFWFLYFLEITSNITLSAIGWAILCWLPSWSSAYYIYYTETLLLPALGLALYLIWRAVRVRNLDAMILAVLAGSFAMHSKQSAAPDVLIAIGWMFYKIKDWKKIVPAGLILLFIGFFIPFVYFHSLIGTMNPLGELRFNQLASLMGPRYFAFNVKPDIKSRIYLSKANFPTWYFGPMIDDAKQFPIAPFGSYESFYTRMDDLVIIELGSSWTKRVIMGKMHWDYVLLSWSRNVIMGLFDDTNPVGATWWERKTHRAIAFVWAPLLCLIVYFNWRVMKQAKRYYFTPCLCMALWFMFLLFPTGFTHGRYRKPFEGQLIGNGLWLIEYARRRKLSKTQHEIITDDWRIAA